MGCVRVEDANLPRLDPVYHVHNVHPFIFVSCMYFTRSSRARAIHELLQDRFGPRDGEGGTGGSEEVGAGRQTDVGSILVSKASRAVADRVGCLNYFVPPSPSRSHTH